MWVLAPLSSRQRRSTWVNGVSQKPAIIYMFKFEILTYCVEIVVCMFVQAHQIICLILSLIKVNRRVCNRFVNLDRRVFNRFNLKVIALHLHLISHGIFRSIFQDITAIQQVYLDSLKLRSGTSGIHFRTCKFWLFGRAFALMFWDRQIKRDCTRLWVDTNTLVWIYFRLMARCLPDLCDVRFVHAIFFFFNDLNLWFRWHTWVILALSIRCHHHSASLTDRLLQSLATSTFCAQVQLCCPRYCFLLFFLIRSLSVHTHFLIDRPILSFLSLALILFEHIDTSLLTLPLSHKRLLVFRGFEFIPQVSQVWGAPLWKSICHYLGRLR